MNINMCDSHMSIVALCSVVTNSSVCITYISISVSSHLWQTHTRPSSLWKDVWSSVTLLNPHMKPSTLQTNLCLLQDIRRIAVTCSHRQVTEKMKELSQSDQPGCDVVWVFDLQFQRVQEMVRHLPVMSGRYSGEGFSEAVQPSDEQFWQSIWLSPLTHHIHPVKSLFTTLKNKTPKNSPVNDTSVNMGINIHL